METNKASSFIGKSITLNSSKILPVIDRLKNLKMFNLLPYNKANNQKGLTYSIEAKLIKKFETLEKFSYSITETSSVQALNYFDQNNSKQDNVLTWYDNLLEKSSSILLLRLCQLLSYKDTDLTKQYIENNPNSIVVYENQLKTANMIYSDIQLEAETNKDFKPILKVITELEKVYSEIKDDKIECQQRGINLDELDFENQILRMANFTAQNWDLKLKTLESTHPSVYEYLNQSSEDFFTGLINGYLSKTLAKNSESLSDFKAKSVGTFIRDSIQVFNAPDKLPQKLLLFTILKFWQNVPGGDSVVLRDPQTTKDGIDSKKEFQLLPDLKTLPDLNSKILPNFKNNDFLKNNSISPNLGDEGNQGSVNDGNPPNFRGGGDGGSGNNNNPPNNLISEENFSNSSNSSNFPLKEREEQQNRESNTNQGMEQTNITIARSDLSQSYVFLKPPKFKISTVRTNNESINKVVDEGNKIIDNYNKLSNEHLDSARLEVQNQNNNQPIPYSGFMGDLENMSQENIPQENIDNDFTI